MKRIVLIVFIGLIVQLAFGQDKMSLGIDCNPILNKHEIEFFDSLFAKENYDFNNKVVGFATPNVLRVFGLFPIPGFDQSLLPFNKKEYFQYLAMDSKDKNSSKLLLLDDSLKKMAKGFDAIILYIPKRKLGKVNPETALKISTVFGYRAVNYPNNLDKVGMDTSSILNFEEVKFFNQIFWYDQPGFDFANKKIVIVDYYSKSIERKQDYIHRIQKHLENDFRYPTDDLIMLTDHEKAETGFDAVIILPEKMYKRNELIEIIKKFSASTPHSE